MDVFFWVGGFLSGYVLTNARTLSQFKKRGRIAIFQTLAFRLGRILPTYFLIIMIIYYILPYLGSGPRWSSDISSGCDEWWHNLTFHLFKTSDQRCMGWSWYLDNDIRLFLSCSFIVYLQSKSSRLIGKLLTIVALTIS